jgi:tRNA-modifying protein YgfZ
MTSALSDVAQFQALMNGEATIATLRDVIVASGPDTETFLQGQLSQDVSSIDVGTSKYTLHLQPNGRVIALARLTRFDADTLVLDTEQGCGERMHAALSRFLIRTKCTLTLTHDVPTTLCPGSLESPGTSRSAGSSTTSAPPDAASILPLVVSSLPFYPGIDILGRASNVDVRFAVDVPPAVDAPVAEAFRISVGIPGAGRELLESTIPSETGLTDVAVTFGKGCYVGQELVERIDSRGRTVRSIRRLVSSSVNVEPFILASDVSHLDLVCDGEVIGRLTSFSLHPVDQRLVALGLVRAHIDVDTEVTTTINGTNVIFTLVS